MDTDRLKAIDVFDALGTDALHKLSIFATETSVPAGHVLLREGDYPRDLITIQQGEAEVLRGGRRVGTLGPGGCCGEAALLFHSRRTATVVATTPMRLIGFSVSDLRRAGAGIDLELAAVFEQRLDVVTT